MGELKEIPFFLKMVFLKPLRNTIFSKNGIFEAIKKYHFF